MSGPGAGTVRRLGLGVHRIGPGAGASLQLSEPTAPSVEIEVAADGSVPCGPSTRRRGARVPAPVRVRPLEGPIVVRSRTRPSPSR